MNPFRDAPTLPARAQLAVFDGPDDVDAQLRTYELVFFSVQAADGVDVALELALNEFKCDINVTFDKHPSGATDLKRAIVRHSPLIADIAGDIANIVAYQPLNITAFGSLCATVYESRVVFEPFIRLEVIRDGDLVTIRDPRARGAQVTSNVIPMRRE